MNLLDGMKKNSIITNTKGSKYYETTYNINLDGWRRSFEKVGYKLPKIIFWNVAGRTNGVPATKFDNDVAMISGFSKNILENILTLENYTPVDVMLEKLAIYLEMLKK